MRSWPKCRHCGADGAEHEWDLRPCALGKKLTAPLCNFCDSMLNDMVLHFFNTPNRRRIMVKYHTKIAHEEGLADAVQRYRAQRKDRTMTDKTLEAQETATMQHKQIATDVAARPA